MREAISDNTKTATLDNIEALVAASDPPTGVTVSVSGNPAFAAQMKSEMGSQMGVLIGAALILMVIVMGILFSYVSYRFIPVVFVALGLTSALGLMGLFGIRTQPRGARRLPGHDRARDRLRDPVPRPA